MLLSFYPGCSSVGRLVRHNNVLIGRDATLQFSYISTCLLLILLFSQLFSGSILLSKQTSIAVYQNHQQSFKQLFWNILNLMDVRENISLTKHFPHSPIPSFPHTYSLTSAHSPVPSRLKHDPHHQVFFDMLPDTRLFPRRMCKASCRQSCWVSTAIKPLQSPDRKGNYVEVLLCLSLRIFSMNSFFQLKRT